jgi:hypothetical protein
MAVKKRLTPEGEFILVDVFRDEGQHLPNYLDAYCEKMANEWKTLTKEEMIMKFLLMIKLPNLSL